jgi:2,3-dihydroxybenzoate-AMP ligase
MIDGVVPFPPEFAARYRALGYWRDQPLRDVFAELFRTHADRVAVIGGDERITYRQLDERSTRLACNLADLGLDKGDRVVVQLPNTATFCYLYFALQKLGAIPVLALPSHRYREIAHFVSLSDAHACAVPERHKDFSYVDMISRIVADQDRPLLGLTPGTVAGFVSLDDLVTKQPVTRPEDLAAVDIDPEEPAVFLLSGGTTGVPKLIPRSHNDYAFNSRLAASVCDIRPDDVLLLVLPIEHNLPLACPGLQGFMLHGATTVLSTSSAPRQVFELVERHRVTHIHLVPALLIRWLADPGIAGHDLSSLRVLQSGGQRLQPEVRDRAAALVPNALVQENFGMAEGLLMFVRLDDPDEVRRETCGRPVCPEDEVRLVDDTGRDVPDGEVGELWVRGPYTLRGYFRAPEHNAVAFTLDGFYRTGDLMCRHPSGNYVVAGRRKDLINRGGEKISAEEVENLVLAHPDVVNAACVPVPDDVLGERMCACVVLRAGTTLDLPALVEFLEKFEIAKHKLPERLEVFAELPLSPVGKVSKKDLVRRMS